MFSLMQQSSIDTCKELLDFESLYTIYCTLSCHPNFSPKLRTTYDDNEKRTILYCIHCKVTVCISTSARVVPMGHSFLTLLIINKQSVKKLGNIFNWLKAKKLSLNVRQT